MDGFMDRLQGGRSAQFVLLYRKSCSLSTSTRFIAISTSITYATSHTPLYLLKRPKPSKEYQKARSHIPNKGSLHHPHHHESSRVPKSSASPSSDYPRHYPPILLQRCFPPYNSTFVLRYAILSNALRQNGLQNVSFLLSRAM